MPVDFSKYQSNSNSSGSKVDFSKHADNSTSVDFSKYTGGAATAKTPSSGGWNGILDNPIVHGIGDAVGAVGQGLNQFENFTGLNHVAGAVKGISNPTQTYKNPYANDKSALGLKNIGGEFVTQAKNLGESAYQGFRHPDETSTKFNANLNNGIDALMSHGSVHALDPVTKAALSFEGQAGTDPLTFVPIGGALKMAGRVVKGVSDVAGITPYAAKGLKAVAKSPLVKNAVVSGAKDKLGTMFVKNHGASPEMSNVLNGAVGVDAMHHQAILNSLADLSKGHGLTQQELNQIGHVIEGTVPGTPAQQAFAQKWQDLALHGPGWEKVELPPPPKEPTNLDELVNSKGFSQVTPETIAQTYNGKTWYHGTGTDKLTANTLNPFTGSHESLFGQGVYLTDNPKIASGYAAKRGARTGTPTVNDLNVNVNRVLDIQKPITGDVKAAIDKTVKPLDYQYEQHIGDPNYFTNLMHQEMSKPGATPEGVITALRKEVSDFSHQAEIPTSEFVDNFQDLAVNLKQAGYDALTHTGGARTGKDPHRVMIMLDPQNWHGATAGQGTQVTRMGKYAEDLAPKTTMQLKDGFSPIGTNAMLHTASAVNGEPILQSQIPNWFKHMYDSVPNELKGVFPKQEQGVAGLSPNGTFNLPRTFATLQDAQQAGLKPVLDPYHVLGEHLSQSSRALTNNEVIKQIKSTPGLLFSKDPIDEVAKLVKTGRMNAEQAAQSLGMTLDDLKKGLVQSKIPQLSGSYIRPADDAALVEHLKPAQPTGAMGLFNKVNNLYNKGFLLNPLPHLHNVYTNGVGLGEANTAYIRQTLGDLNKGNSNPWYSRALKAGAVNKAVNGKFSDAVRQAVAPKEGNVLKRTVSAATNSAKNIYTGTGKLADNLKAPFMPLKDASHDLLWNSDAAIRTSLFRGAIESGATDAEAAKHTNKFMVDYRNLTPFEKKYVRPLINFYAWKKGNTALQVTQKFNQTPKYAAYGHAKDAVSQAISGQPTDQKGRIQTKEQLPDGSSTVIDPYVPMDDLSKISDKGIPTYLYNSLNPGVKEAITQGTSLSQVAGLPVQNKFPIYNPAAPLEYNIRSGLAHAVNYMNPFNNSAVVGQGINQSNLINRAFGMPTSNKPNQTMLDAGTKLLGGFTARNNPATDAKNKYYQNKDTLVNFRKYKRDVAKAKR